MLLACVWGMEDLSSRTRGIGSDADLQPKRFKSFVTPRTQPDRMRHNGQTQCLDKLKFVGLLVTMHELRGGRSGEGGEEVSDSW